MAHVFLGFKFLFHMSTYELTPKIVDGIFSFGILDLFMQLKQN